MNMQTKPLILFIVFTSLVSVRSDGGPKEDAGPEAGTANAPIVANGGFEIASGDLPDQWNLDQAVTGKGQASLDRSKGRGGGVALKLSPNANNQPGPQPFALGQVIQPQSLRGKKLRISAWLGADDGATAVVGMYLLRKGGQDPGGLQLRQPANQGRLVRLEDTLKTPVGDDVEMLILFVAVESTNGAAYFDDVTIEVVSEADTDSTPQRDQTELQARVTVLADRKVRDIPRTLFGTNVEWINNGNGIWDTTTSGLVKQIVGLARRMNISRIRFGSDSYHWRDGIGPQATRPTKRHWAGGKGDASSRHTFGTDEALALAEDAGASLHIIANAGTGTPQEAAEWVRYVNGKDRPKEQHVEFWEIGNELYMKDDSSGASLPPEQYAQRFLEFARAMKAEDPSIKLAAIGGENFGRYAFVSYPDWDKTVLKLAADQIDYLAVHNAYAPVLVGSKDVDLLTVYKALLAAPVLIKKNLETISQQIDAFAGDNAPRIKIAVTEWGPLFHALPSSPYVDHVKTLASGLFVASTMKVFIESPRTDVANFFKLTEPSFMGWIGKYHDRHLPKAPFYAFTFFSRHFGDVVVESRVESPTYDSPGAGTVSPVDNVPYLDIVSSKSSDGVELKVIGINKHFDRPIRASISLQGFTPLPRAGARTLSGTGPDANTGTELPALPSGWSWAKQAELEPYRRFHAGRPGEVAVESRYVDVAGADFTYTFPPCSLTLLTLQKAD